MQKNIVGFIFKNFYPCKKTTGCLRIIFQIMLTFNQDGFQYVFYVLMRFVKNNNPAR